MDINDFKKLPLIGILRGINPNSIEPLAEAISHSGLKTIEITMNTEGAPELIQKIKKSAKNRFTVGAGTVLTVDNLKRALDAGATFIVLPTLVEEVVKYCVKNKIPVFPGALTPHEIYNAWRAGATMVKVFPAKFFGPSYFKEVKAPLQDVELLACGGVTPENIHSFFDNGASAVAFGASAFRKELLSSGNFSRIEDYIRALVQAFRKRI